MSYIRPSSPRVEILADTGYQEMIDDAENRVQKASDSVETTLISLYRDVKFKCL